MATVLAYILSAPPWGIAILILSAVLMVSLELANSAIERLVDMVEPNRDPRVKAIKDIAAAAVFVAGVFFVLFWLYLVIPPLLS